MRAAVRLYKIGNTGYVRPVVTDAAQLRGCADALREAGAIEWHVDAPPEAAGFEALGLQVAHHSTVLHFAWANLARLPAELATVTTGGDDDDLERAFDLPAGRIEMARRPERSVVELRAADLSVLGFAVADPDAAPLFYVARPALAAALLAALRRHAHAHAIELVIADDDALVATLVTAGASVVRRVLHYSGPLTTTAAARCA